jgi:hypothetical protein
LPAASGLAVPTAISTAAAADATASVATAALISTKPAAALTPRDLPVPIAAAALTSAARATTAIAAAALTSAARATALPTTSTSTTITPAALASTLPAASLPAARATDDSIHTIAATASEPTIQRAQLRRAPHRCFHELHIPRRHLGCRSLH